MMKLKFKSNTILKGRHDYFKAIEKATERSLKAGGLQYINNIVNGSPASSAVPPKLTGHLRGSGSAFVGSIFVGDTSSFEAGGTPNRNFSESNSTTITVGFDTPYAAKMNEQIGVSLKLGPVSQQSGNVEFHFMQKHIEGDAKEILQLIADITKRDTGG